MNSAALFRSGLDGGIILRDHFGGDVAAYLQAAKAAASAAKRARTVARRREFDRWRTMIRRCTDPAADSFEYYGGRGITVCARWMSFDAYFSDMGPAPAGMTLDRINPDGHYEPENCRWATDKEQAANKRAPAHAPRGSVSLINGKWRALVRIKGRSRSKFFQDRVVAAEWARQTAAELSA